MVKDYCIGTTVKNQEREMYRVDESVPVPREAKYCKTGMTLHN